MNKALADSVRQKYVEQFGEEPLIVRSPGRVNIIGEHTDYNEGFVLPAAIDKAIYVGIGKSEDGKTIHLFSGEFNEAYQTTLDNIHPTERGWPNYVLGVVDQLKKRGYSIKGFSMVVDGDVPIGAGLSSSAAVECAVAFALSQFFNLNIGKRDLDFIAQKAEHEFAGVLCGIMDQFDSVFGKKDHVIKLDCRSIEYEYVPLKLEGYKILLLNTNVKHSLASSEYNKRRQECEQGVAWVKEHHPDVNSLRDVTKQMLDEHVKPKDDLVYRRCKYVVEENERLITGCDDLKTGRLEALGQKMFQTHDGLSKDYSVSCKELDYLVDAVRSEEAVLGARMMGGGFGGCTINLVKENAIDELIQKLGPAYKQAMGKEITAYVAQIEDGTSLC